jgi:hypothetical protein
LLLPSVRLQLASFDHLPQIMTETPTAEELYNTWHFYNQPFDKSIEISDIENTSLWTSEAEFSWSGEISEIEKTLWSEGVVKLGQVSERYLGVYFHTMHISICFFDILMVLMMSD